MTQLAEVKRLLEEKLTLVDTLRTEHDELKGDYIGKESYAKLEALVGDVSKKYAEFDAAYQKDLAETKALAEEASLKAGRRGSGADEDAPDVVQVEHKSAFETYMRNRQDPDALKAVREAEEKALGSAAGSGGGVAIPTLLDAEISRKTSDESLLRGVVRTIQVGSPDYKKLVNKGGAGFAWVGTGDTRDRTDNAGYYLSEPTTGTIYAYPEYAEETLDDVFFDLEGEVVMDVGEAFGNGMDVAIIGGTGTKMPTGMLATPPVADEDGARADMVFQYLASGAADSIGTGDELVKLVYQLKRKYRRNASWMMNDLTASAVRVLKDANGRFLWADGLVPGQPDRLLGYGVNAVDALPDIAANATPIGFGDWMKAYTVIELHGTRITKDEITEPGMVKWHIRRRLGGKTTNDDAGKWLKCATS